MLRLCCRPCSGSIARPQLYETYNSREHKAEHFLKVLRLALRLGDSIDGKSAGCPINCGGWTPTNIWGTWGRSSAGSKRENVEYFPPLKARVRL